MKRFQLTDYSVYFYYSYDNVVIDISSWYFINIPSCYIKIKELAAGKNK